MALLFRLFLYLVIIISAVFHEFMHGWTANQLGDPTAKHAGRLTLNPLKHIDLIGTVLLPLILLTSFGTFIGWAKPVPYNPLNLTDRRYDSSKVAFAGPLANFVIAIFFGLVIRFIPVSETFRLTFSWIAYINISLAFFNLIPIPPLDGSKLLMDFVPSSIQFLGRISFFGVILALFAAFLFLRPVANYFYLLIAGNQFFPAVPF